MAHRWFMTCVAALLVCAPGMSAGQAPLVPPPNVPYGLSITTQNAKKVAAAASGGNSVQDGQVANAGTAGVSR